MSAENESVYLGKFNDHDLCIRWASHQDFDDVMRIDESVYSGLDYLPATYHEALSDPATCNFIAEIDGKVVFYGCFWFCGQDNTITLGTAGRIHKRYRNLGLQGFIFTQLLPAIKKLYPNLRCNWGVSLYNETTAKIAKELGSKLIDIWYNVHCHMSPESLDAAVTTRNSVIKVDSPGLSTILNLLSDKHVIDYLYPKGYIFLADRWMVNTTSQIPKVIRKSDVYVSGSLSSGDLGVSNVYANRCAIGLILVVAYAGYPDIDVLMSHVLKAAKQYNRTSGLLAGEYQRMEHTPAGKHTTEHNIHEPKLALCVRCSMAIDRASIRDALLDIFQCEVVFDFYPEVALYETKY